MEALLGPSLVTKSGAVTPTAEALAGARFVGAYFSAHWCGPCRGFTPQLSAFYAAHAERLAARVVFVSSDRDEKAMAEYFASMAWDLALPFGDEHKEVVGGDVRGIPTLKIFDAASGALVCADARACVGLDPEGAFFPWAADTPGWEEARRERASAQDAARAVKRAAHFAAMIAAPAHAHPLRALTRAECRGHACDCCGEPEQRVEGFFNCAACNYDECNSCFVKRGGVLPAAAEPAAPAAPAAE